MWLLLVTTIFATYLIQKYINHYNYWKRKGISAEVKPWPLFGCAVENIFELKSMAEVLTDVYFKFPNDKVIGYHSFVVPILIVKDLNLIKQICVKQFDSFTDHAIIFNEDNDSFFGKSLFAIKGQRWRDMRNTLSPAFTSSKMKAMVPFMQQCANQLVVHYSQDMDKQDGRVTVEAKDLLTRYTNDVIASTAFGIQCDSFKEKDNVIFRAGKALTNFPFSAVLVLILYELCSPIAKFLGLTISNKEATGFFRKTIIDNIRTREEKKIVRGDMVDLLLQARKGQLKDEGDSEDAGFATVEEVSTGKSHATKLKLTDDEIVAQAFLFYFAGYETSSSVMSLMAYELALHEDIQRKLQSEIDTTLAKSNGALDYNIIRSMKYLDMVVSETLRKWPTVVLTERLCTKPHIVQVSDYNSLVFEKGMSVWFPVFAIHRDPKYYPDPERFDPERFNAENKTKIDPFSYMPFGTGPRNCIGSRFALLEIKVLFIVLLKNFDLTVTEKTQVPLKLKKSGFNLAGEGGIWLALKKRQSLS